MPKRTMLAAVLSIAIAMPLGAAAHDTGDCGRGQHATFATLISPEDGKLQANTTPTGHIGVSTGLDAPAVFVSTTGEIVAEYEYACLTALTLTVTREGETTPFHTNTINPACDHATGSETVEIGLEAGRYSFQLSGETCSGAPVVTDGHGGFVADPPVL